MTKRSIPLATMFVPGALLLLGLWAACTPKGDEGPAIRLDMSAEHDESRFKPEVGDVISIAGGFNGWQRDTLFLADHDGDWIYTLPLEKLTQEAGSPVTLADTLIFKFVHTSGDGRQLANQGWETIENRQLPLATVVDQKPTLTFNEPYDERRLANVTFTVGMKNQEVLGFFKPEAGDQVIVSGDFCDWSETGIPLHDSEGDGIYQASVPVKFHAGKPIRYKYRILTKREAVLQNGGWESRQDRSYLISEEEPVIPYAAFQDVRRVARFIISTQAWEDGGKFHPMQGDVLQIRLLLDEHEMLTDALFPVKKHVYETAVTIPLTVQRISWQVVRNMKEEALTPQNDIEVGLEGRVVEWMPTISS